MAASSSAAANSTVSTGVTIIVQPDRMTWREVAQCMVDYIRELSTLEGVKRSAAALGRKLTLPTGRPTEDERGGKRDGDRYLEDRNEGKSDAKIAEIENARRDRENERIIMHNSWYESKQKKPLEHVDQDTVRKCIDYARKNPRPGK